MSSRHLLLVDTDPAVHKLLADVLKRDDRSIQDVYDGAEALECIRNSAYDLIVAGPGRNGYDGLELLRTARRLRPGTPVILTAEEPSRARVIRAITEHAYGYFHKPLAAGHVADMVEQALDASSWDDDIEVLSGSPEWTTLAVSCKMEAADRTAHFLREAEIHLPAPVREDVTAAFRELLFNAIEHGGKCDPAKRVEVNLVHTRRAVIVRIQDPGAGFSMESLSHAAVTNPEGSPIRHVEVRTEHGQRPGGFGILMTRNLVDELVYNERGNGVLFVKYL